jgi:hypothetical protein
LDGQKIDLATPMSNSYRSTLEFVTKFDKMRRAQGMDWRLGKVHDLNSWGCSLIMEVNGNPSSGGVTGYSVQVLSSYVRAINHFNWQIERTRELRKKIEELQGGKPQL